MNLKGGYQIIDISNFNLFDYGVLDVLTNVLTDETKHLIISLIKMIRQNNVNILKPVMVKFRGGIYTSITKFADIVVFQNNNIEIDIRFEKTGTIYRLLCELLQNDNLRVTLSE